MERGKRQDFEKKVEELKKMFDREDWRIQYLCDDECKNFKCVKSIYTDHSEMVKHEVVTINYTNEILVIKNHAINVMGNSERANLKIVAGALTGFYTFLGQKKQPVGYMGNVPIASKIF